MFSRGAYELLPNLDLVLTFVIFAAFMCFVVMPARWLARNVERWQRRQDEFLREAERANAIRAAEFEERQNERRRR